MTGNVPRVDLAAALTPTLPEGWRIVDKLGEADNADVTTLRLSQLTLRRIQAAPRARSVAVVFEAVLTVPSGSLEHAEDDLDDRVVEWLVGLTALGLGWTEFTKTMTGEDRLGYRGEITTTAQLDTSTTQEA